MGEYEIYVVRYIYILVFRYKGIQTSTLWVFFKKKMSGEWDEDSMGIAKTYMDSQIKIELVGAGMIWDQVPRVLTAERPWVLLAECANCPTITFRGTVPSNTDLTMVLEIARKGITEAHERHAIMELLTHVVRRSGRPTPKGVGKRTRK